MMSSPGMRRLLSMFNVGRNEEEETRKFWESVERETGLPVLQHALGQYMSGYGDREGPVWGLLYVTEESLYFRHFPSGNWFTAIMNASGGDRKRDEGFTIQLPVNTINRVEHEEQTSLWERIFRPRPSVTVIHYLAGQVERELRLTIEHRGKEFREQLHALVGEYR